MTEVVMAPASDWSSHHSQYDDDRSSTHSMHDIDSIPSSPSSTYSPMRTPQGGKRMISSHPHAHPTSRNLFPNYENKPYPTAYPQPDPIHHGYTQYPASHSHSHSYPADDMEYIMHDRMISNLSKLLAVANGVDGISETESGQILHDLGVTNQREYVPPTSAQKNLSLPPTAAASYVAPTINSPLSDTISMSTPSSMAPSIAPSTPPPHTILSPSTPLHQFQSNLEQLQQQVINHQKQCELLKQEKEVLNQTLQQFQASISMTQDELSRQLALVTQELGSKDIALQNITREKEEEKVQYDKIIQENQHQMEEMRLQEQSVRQERDRIFNELSHHQQHHSQHQQHLKQQLHTLQQQVETLHHEKYQLRENLKQTQEGMNMELEKAIHELKIKEAAIASHSTTHLAEIESLKQHIQQLLQEKEQLTSDLSQYHSREQSMLLERSQLTQHIQEITTQLLQLKQNQQLKEMEIIELNQENESLKQQKMEIQQAHATTESSLLARLSSLMNKLSTNDNEYAQLIQQQQHTIESLTTRNQLLNEQLAKHDETLQNINQQHHDEITNLQHRLGGVEDELETTTHQLSMARNEILRLQAKLDYLLRRSYSKGQVLEIVFCLQLVLLVSYLALDWSNGIVMGNVPTFS